MSLLSIPNSLLKVIAYHLIEDPKDLVNFGKVCKVTNKTAEGITENDLFHHLKSLCQKRHEMQKRFVDPVEKLKKPIRNLGLPELNSVSEPTYEIEIEFNIANLIQTEARKVAREFLKKVGMQGSGSSCN